MHVRGSFARERCPTAVAALPEVRPLRPRNGVVRVVVWQTGTARPLQAVRALMATVGPPYSSEIARSIRF